MLAGDVVSIGNQERYGFGYFLRFRESLEGDSRCNLFENVGGDAGDHVGCRIARCDDICGNVVLRQFQRDRLGKGDDGAFAGRIICLAVGARLADE